MSKPESDQKLPSPVLDHLPTTFLERGIAVPFTTPQLAGARVRPGERAPMELIVPNPSGTRGVYIIPWENMASLCRPTVHDLKLAAMVGNVHGVTPASVRRAARQAAAQGFAGRAAATAARAAEDADRQAGLVANFSLLLELVRAVEKPGENPMPPEQEHPAALEKRARRAVARIAPELGRTPEAIAAGLEQIGALYSGIGLRANQTGARLLTLVARLLRARKELADYLVENPLDGSQEASLVAGAIDLTVTCARATLADGHAASADIVALLKQWITAPDDLSQKLARPEWLLDGWDRIAALWETAERPAGAADALAEICDLVPLVPREAGSWVSQHINIEIDITRLRRKVTLLEDWRSGRSITDVVARNENVITESV